MERAGVIPRGAVAAPDLAEVVAGPGPFVTVLLATEADVENAAQRSEQHWKSVRRALAEAGAPEYGLAEIDPLVPDAHLHGQTLAVVANANGVRHVEHGPDVPPRDEWWWAPLPRLLPVLAWRQRLVTHVTVRADRTGADIAVHLHDPALQHGNDVREEIEGRGYPVAKNKPGGWSQPRYQRRAENTWEHNAHDVAHEVSELVERFDARLVVVAGDVRALELIREALPEPLLERVHVVAGGGRTEDGSDDIFAARVRERVEAAVAEDTAAMLEKFREELGQADRATDGPDDTLAALARAQVEVLLLAKGIGADPRIAFFGPEPTHVGHTPEELTEMSVDDPQEAPLADVAVRAALGTRAAVRVVPDGELPTGRVGAILRW